MVQDCEKSCVKILDKIEKIRFFLEKKNFGEKAENLCLETTLIIFGWLRKDR